MILTEIDDVEDLVQRDEIVALRQSMQVKRVSMARCEATFGGNKSIGDAKSWARMYPDVVKTEN